jgi:hypothetical protein
MRPGDLAKAMAPREQNSPRPIRQIRGLLVAALCDTPAWAEQKKKEKKRAKLRAGLRFERQFQKHLARSQTSMDRILVCNPWIHFRDKAGAGFAQPDVLLFDRVSCIGALIEIKLTQSLGAEEQLTGLYLPLVQFCYPDIHWRRVQVCKNLRNVRSLVETIEDVMDPLCEEPERPFLLEWRPE